MLSSVLVALAGLATVATASPIAHPPRYVPSQSQPLHRRQGNGTDACAGVREILYSGGNRPIRDAQIPAGIAYECLSSVPLNATDAKHLLNALPTWLNWQSTLMALKDPPAEYTQKVQPPTDILGGLKMIEADIDAGKLETEYEFGWSLYTLILSAHDGHLSFIPDSIGSIFTWGRPIPLVSVSEDGEKVPSVFVYDDVLGIQFKNISYTPSPVVKIDGQDATEWLEHLAQFGSLQDRDALYNNLFYELAQVSLGYTGSATGMFAGGGRGRWVYPGATTTLTFENGTSYTMENFARVHINFQNIYSAEDLQRLYFYYSNEAASAAKIETLNVDEKVDTFQTAKMAQVFSTRQSAPPPDHPPGYPIPEVEGPGGIINGFFIDDPEYQDVAVLQVPNFVGLSSYEIAFQRTSQQFLPMAVAAGKTKLIIDVQANGGGTILQGYDLAKQLFPSMDPYGGNRFRAHEAVDLIGEIYSDWASKFPRSPNLNYSVTSIESSYFDYRTDMTVDAQPFSSWDEKFGPYESNGDMYTTPHRWNLSDVFTPINSGGINITGYGPLANLSGRPAPFKPENIVILTDGYCASTCTIFSELLTKQAGVKTIFMGGRSNSDPAQAIGGVKGTNNYGFSYIQNLAQQAVNIAPDDRTAYLRNESALEGHYDDIVFSRSASAPGVNVRDGLGFQDDSGIALQFKYEEADCRLYYTPEMTVDVTSIWKAAADAQWRDSGKCVGRGSGYGKDKRDQLKTKGLGRRGKQMVSAAAATMKVKAFENTFALETKCEFKGDGFMHP